jgi:hypothetical protein
VPQLAALASPGCYRERLFEQRRAACSPCNKIHFGMRRDRNDRPTSCWQKRTEGRFVVGVKGHGDGFAADAIFPSAVLFCALRRLPAIWLAGHAQAAEVGVGGAISSTILPSACCPPRPAQNAHFVSIVLSWPTTVMIASTIPAAITPPSMIVAAFLINRRSFASMSNYNRFAGPRSAELFRKRWRLRTPSGAAQAYVAAVY